MEQYVGLDWAYRRARWCAMAPDGSVLAEDWAPADEDGLARLVARLGADVTACVEMMSAMCWTTCPSAIVPPSAVGCAGRGSSTTTPRPASG